MNTSSTFGNARWVSVGVVARVLGVDRRTVWTWIRDGACEAIKPGAHYRVSVSWIRSRKPPDER